MTSATAGEDRGHRRGPGAARDLAGGVIAAGLPGPDIDVDLIAEAVLACRSVAALDAGTFGELATYLPGRQVPGIRLDPVEGSGPGADRVEVHVVGRYPAAMSEISAEIRAALDGAVGGRIVDVYVEDYSLPGE